MDWCLYDNGLRHERVNKVRAMERIFLRNRFNSQPAFTSSKLTIETLEQCVKYVQS